MATDSPVQRRNGILHQSHERCKQPAMALAFPNAFQTMLLVLAVQSRAASRENCVGKKGHREREQAMRDRGDNGLDRRSRERGEVGSLA